MFLYSERPFRAVGTTREVSMQTLNKFSAQRRSTLLAALGCAAVPFGSVIADITTYPELHLSLYNLHTTEKFNGAFWVGGEYDPDALRQINHLLRDHRTDEVKSIDVKLLSILYLVSKKVGKPDHPFSVISGYRSAATNRKLAKSNSGVARNSYHIKGQAIDIRLNGTDTKNLREAGLALRVGGVGYYEKSNFVHLDTGPYRAW